MLWQFVEKLWRITGVTELSQITSNSNRRFQTGYIRNKIRMSFRFIGGLVK